MKVEVITVKKKIEEKQHKLTLENVLSFLFHYYILFPIDFFIGLLTGFNKQAAKPRKSAARDFYWHPSSSLPWYDDPDFWADQTGDPPYGDNNEL